MTLSLFLFRHAKSAWDDPEIEDYDRPLAARGRAAAIAMGRWMKAAAITPDLVLCSTAARAQQTALLAFEQAGWPGTTLYDRRLYLASADGMMDVLRRRCGAARRVMLIGHNPGMESLAGRLVADGDDALRMRMAEKYPTAALAQIDFGAAGWELIDGTKGALARFQVPRAL